MKLTDLGLVFAMLFICMAVIDDSRTMAIDKMSATQIQYNRALDQAAEDAMYHLVETDTGREIKINKEDAVEQFYNSLFINMGIMENARLKEYIKLFIPVICMIDRDGYYIYGYDSAEKKTENNQIMSFSEKIPYLWEDNEYVIQFTLSDIVTVIRKKTKEEFSGNYHDVGEIIACPVLNKMNFDEIRRNTIITSLTEQMTKYISDYNQIAGKYGIRYTFRLPVIEKEDWYRTIDDISILALFQGLPVGSSRMGYYNRFAVAGARIKKD